MKYVMLAFMVFLVWAVVVVIREENRCKRLGGVPTRIGCVNPDSFIVRP